MNLINKESIDHIQVVCNEPVFGMRNYEPEVAIKIFGRKIVVKKAGWRDIFGNSHQSRPRPSEMDFNGRLVYKPYLNLVSKSGRYFFMRKFECREDAEKFAFDFAQEHGIKTIKL